MISLDTQNTNKNTQRSFKRNRSQEDSLPRVKIIDSGEKKVFINQNSVWFVFDIRYYRA